MEVWRDIPGLIGFYQASDKGRIRSLPRQVPTKGGATRIAGGKVLSPCNLGRYQGVLLSVEGKRRTGLVHRLVCSAFHGAPPAGAQAAHGDGDSANNTPSNLRWATAKENCLDRRSHGTWARGERVNTAKLTSDDVREIRSRASSGASPKAIAADFDVHVSSVHQILRGDTWKHLDP